MRRAPVIDYQGCEPSRPDVLFRCVSRVSYDVPHVFCDASMCVMICLVEVRPCMRSRVQYRNSTPCFLDESWWDRLSLSFRDETFS